MAGRSTRALESDSLGSNPRLPKTHEVLGKPCNLPFLPCSRENNDGYISGLFGRLSGMVWVRRLASSWAHSKCSMDVSY